MQKIDLKSQEETKAEMHNKITNIAITYIVTAIFYNFLSVKNTEFDFVNPKFIDDIWFVIEYGISGYLFWYLRANIYAKIAAWIVLVRFIYNLGILVNLIEYKAYFESYFVPIFSVLVLIYYKVKVWRL